jgi:hypothetical protein
MSLYSNRFGVHDSDLDDEDFGQYGRGSAHLVGYRSPQSSSSSYCGWGEDGIRHSLKHEAARAIQLFAQIRIEPRDLTAKTLLARILVQMKRECAILKINFEKIKSRLEDESMFVPQPDVYARGVAWRGFGFK